MTEIIDRPDSALKDFKDIPPPTFDQEKGGAYIISTLNSRPLWQKRPREDGKPDPIHFTNLQSGRMYDFDATNLKTHGTVDLLNNGEGFNGAVIVAGPMHEPDPEFKKKLVEAVATLRPGGSVFIFEKWGVNVDKEWREEILKEIGLVERNILTSGKKVRGATMWEAHMPKDKGLNEPIDLVENGPYWVKAMLSEMKESYAQEGYVIEDDSKLMHKLKHSTFPLKDIYLIRDRAGVKIRSTLCPTNTCEYEVDTSGNRYTLNECGEEHVKPGSPTPTPELELVKKVTTQHFPGEEVTLEQVCGCGRHFQAKYFQEDGVLKVETFCPSDGFFSLKNAS